MTPDILQFIIENQKKTNVLFQFLKDLISNNKFCHHYLTEGAYGIVTVFDPRLPIKYRFNNGKTLSFKSIAMKTSIIDKYSQLSIKIKDDQILIDADEHAIGEALAAMIISSLFFKGITPHITACLGFSHCKNDKDNVNIFYENLIVKLPDINKDFINNVSNIITNFAEMPRYLKAHGFDGSKRESAIDSIIISMLHTLFVLQFNFKFMHFDLYSRNIFIKQFDDEPYFRGLNMKKIKYFVYQLPNDLFLYVPNHGFIIKIGDVGMSLLSIIDKIIISSDNSFKAVKKIKTKYFNDYPKIKYFIPDYFILLRSFVTIFGLTSSELLRNLLLNIPVLCDSDEISISVTEGTIDVDLSKIPSLESILSDKRYFKKYMKKPFDLTSSNSLHILYKL